MTKIVTVYRQKKCNLSQKLAEAERGESVSVDSFKDGVEFQVENCVCSKVSI